METRRKYYRRRRRRRLITRAAFTVCLLALAGILLKQREASLNTKTEAREESVSLLPEGGEAEENREVPLPERFDLRETIQIPEVPDQGTFGTCWAFASLVALETTMPSAVRTALAADHMSLKNSFSMGLNDGGEYSMAMAYLLAWQGPVAAADDPYGDGVSPDGLSPVCHVQEIRILPEGDRERIKRAVFETGGVQSSLYVPMERPEEREAYYREDTFALFYDGEKEPNHDVVIVGWDDRYPKENFVRQPRRDGAFLCMNSWGSSFGDGGCFYVSYEDTRLGANNVLYAGVEPVTNYDRLHQTDLCGWTGQLGYGGPDAWFANVYGADENEVVEAAGFYAVKEQTSYRVFIAREVPEPDAAGMSLALSVRTLAAEGVLEEAGFYTVPFEQGFPVKAGSRFAVIVEINTPGATQPVAIEYQAGSRTQSVDITDGEGYISFNGNLWKRAEKEEDCNLCLKAYSRVQ